MHFYFTVLPQYYCLYMLYPCYLFTVVVSALVYSKHRHSFDFPTSCYMFRMIIPFKRLRALSLEIAFDLNDTRYTCEKTSDEDLSCMHAT